MGIANFFDKAALGASQILQDFDSAHFKALLTNQTISLRFTSETAESSEGQALLDLLVRLLSRLYPSLQFPSSESTIAYVEPLKALAKAINPEILLSSGSEATILIVVGGHDALESGSHVFYVGSDNWLSFFSTIRPQNCGNSGNPFGAGFSACLGAANVFRAIFGAHLPAGRLDDEVKFSVFDYSVGDAALQGPILGSVSFTDTLLVGVGAVGNGAIWGLRYLKSEGELTLIDNEALDLSNLQRYVLVTQQDVGRSKSDLGAAFFNGDKLSIRAFHGDWANYIAARQNWKVNLVGIGVDSASARIEIQSALPATIINAWTQIEQIGISRHENFPTGACVCCLYFPSMVTKSLSEEIAFNLNLADEERTIRGYLADKRPVDMPLLYLIGQRTGLPLERLEPFQGQLLETFHAQVVCGGILMKITGQTASGQLVNVPSAFESAAAGIFLAAELVVQGGKLRAEKIPNLSKMNLMRPITKYTKEVALKHSSKRCLCQDPIVVNAYHQKWSTT